VSKTRTESSLEKEESPNTSVDQCCLILGFFEKVQRTSGFYEKNQPKNQKLEYIFRLVLWLVGIKPNPISRCKDHIPFVIVVMGSLIFLVLGIQGPYTQILTTSSFFQKRENHSGHSGLEFGPD